MTKNFHDQMQSEDELLLQIQDLKKQMNYIAAKIDCIANNQAIIIGVLNGTIEFAPFYPQNAEKMH